MSVYCLKPGLDVSIEFQQGQQGHASIQKIRQSKISNQFVMEVTSLIRGKTSIVHDGDNVSKLVFKGSRSKTARDVEELFAIEHRVSVAKKTALLAFDGAEITLIGLHPTNSALNTVSKARHRASKILRVTNDMFVTLDESATILRRLTVKAELSEYEVHELVIY